MLKIIVLGAAGRMGSRIIGLLQEADGIRLIGATEGKGHPKVRSDAGEVSGIMRLGIPITDDVKSVIDQGDVVIDFTTPRSTLTQLNLIAEKGKALVIGTTGFEPSEMDQIRKVSTLIPCVFSPNMSVGVNVMFKIAEETAKLLGPDYDLEIIETHHRYKKDAPSGTALKLGEILAAATHRKLEEVVTYARQGQVGERKSGEIGIQSVRAGDVVGDHTIVFGGLGERVEITHRAHSRDNFARGAILAAKWVAHQPPGLYDMAHVLGFSH